MHLRTEFGRKIPVKLQILWLMLFGVLIVCAACGQNSGSENANENGQAVENEQEVVYVTITAKEAKELMDLETGYVILDVRTQEEYDGGHIPGAILIPDTEIENKAEETLTDKEQMILVYCRSGRRSKKAAAALAELGYMNVKEFGGILDWPYEVE